MNITYLVNKAHDEDIHCVDWNPHDINFILTSSTNNTVKMFDRRKLNSGGVRSPIYKFEGHEAAILCVRWCPDKSSVFGSSTEDGFLNIWDHEKVGQISSPYGASAPSSLFF
ncbi:WD-40 repeat-containing protein MSI4-like [Arachis hypogaea]|uniref:WD-40 repeat-containing protein MSI4-like n=1 Tax=Arachis hypogaea TaxID=3818 RepID=UPI003B216BFC